MFDIRFTWNISYTGTNSLTTYLFTIPDPTVPSVIRVDANLSVPIWSSFLHLILLLFRPTVHTRRRGNSVSKDGPQGSISDKKGIATQLRVRRLKRITEVCGDIVKTGTVESRDPSQEGSAPWIRKTRHGDQRSIVVHMIPLHQVCVRSLGRPRQLEPLHRTLD